MKLTEYLTALIKASGAPETLNDFLVRGFYDELRHLYPQINTEHTTYASLEYNAFTFVIPLEISDGYEQRYTQKDLAGWRAFLWRTAGDLFKNPLWKARGRSFKTYSAARLITRSYKVERINFNYWDGESAKTISFYGFYEPLTDTFYSYQKKESDDASNSR